MLQIEQFIENTNLNPDLTANDIDMLVNEAKDYGFVGICVPPFWVKKAKRDLQSAGTRLITVIGFPTGYQRTETKLFEIESNIRDGADEVDMVMNISAFKSGMPWVKIELAQCAELAHSHNVILKVIIETAYLNEQEIIRACSICEQAGTDFVKTSTGFAREGAKTEHVALIRKCLSNNTGIKASGGIRSVEDVIKMIEAGADRIGTSHGAAILKEFHSTSNI